MLLQETTQVVVTQSKPNAKAAIGPRRPINLALQGGGAHGAFTWGVLDYLLEKNQFDIEGISGTSAGAMNAIALAQGYLDGGAKGARKALRRFWEEVAHRNPLRSLPSLPGDSAPAPMKLFTLLSQVLSPEQWNPSDINPLRDIIDEQFDFEALATESKLKLFIAATHANSGKLRLFRNKELTREALLASACLPTLHKAIYIDGEPYWDGGFSANPAIYPLYFECDCNDILLVLLSPIFHKTDPESAAEIKLRAMDIGFNAAFLREMSSFARLMDFFEGKASPTGELERRTIDTRFHLIEAEEFLGELASGSRLNAKADFFERLFKHGRKKAAKWAKDCMANVGLKGTDLALFAA